MTPKAKHTLANIGPIWACLVLITWIVSVYKGDPIDEVSALIHIAVGVGVGVAFWWWDKGRDKHYPTPPDTDATQKDTQ